MRYPEHACLAPAFGLERRTVPDTVCIEVVTGDVAGGRRASGRRGQRRLGARYGAEDPQALNASGRTR